MRWRLVRMLEWSSRLVGVAGEPDLSPQCRASSSTPSSHSGGMSTPDQPATQGGGLPIRG